MAAEPHVSRPAASERLRVAVVSPAGAAALALAAVMVLAVGARIWLAGRIATPWIMADELVYSELAKSLASSADFTLREAARPFVSVTYPALLSPAWLLQPMATTYAVAKVLNVVLMTAAVVPLYLWSRRLVSPFHGLVAVALTLVMPAFIYSGMLMTENAFLPAFVLAAWMFARALERPTLLRQGLAFGTILLASSVRLQALVLAAVLPTAILLKILFELRDAPRERPLRFFGTELRRYWFSGALLAAGAALAVLRELARGRPLSGGLGSYAEVASLDYSFDSARHWLLLHLAELPISVGVLPACALLLLLGLALGPGGARSEAERAFLAVTASAVAWIVLQVAVFASRYALRIEERYMFFLSPLLFLALVLWLDRGLPRPPMPSLVVAAVPVGLVLTLPLGSLLNQTILSDTFGLIPFLRLSQLLPGGVADARRFLLAGVIAAGLLFLLWPRRALPALVLPAAVAAFLALSNYPIVGALRDYSRALRDYSGTAGSPAWIDEHVERDGEAAFLIGTTHQPDAERSVLFQMEFWNRGVGDVLSLVPGLSLFEETPVRILPRGFIVDGADRRVDVPYVVASRDVELDGQVVAERPPLVLYRLSGPLRLGSTTSGIYGDGWMGADASYTRYGERSPPGRVVVSLSREAWRGPDVPGRVRIVLTARGRTETVADWTIHSGAGRTFSVPVPRGGFSVAVHVEPTFSPSQFGSADTRQLGAQVAFAYEPAGP